MCVHVWFEWLGVTIKLKNNCWWCRLCWYHCDWQLNTCRKWLFFSHFSFVVLRWNITALHWCGLVQLICHIDTIDVIYSQYSVDCRCAWKRFKCSHLYQNKSWSIHRRPFSIRNWAVKFLALTVMLCYIWAYSAHASYMRARMWWKISLRKWSRFYLFWFEIRNSGICLNKAIYLELYYMMIDDWPRKTLLFSMIE